MEAKEKARILEISEAAEWNRKVIWMELREALGMVPVTFYKERKPFLMFDGEDRPMMIQVRAEYYGITWRCWDRRPDGQPVPDWESADPEDGIGTGKAAGSGEAAGKAAGSGKAGGKASGKRTGGTGK